MSSQNPYRVQSDGVSARVWRCYKELVRFVDLHGYVPSYAELSGLCNCSISTVSRYLDQLQAAGLIERRSRQARSIVIQVASCQVGTFER